MAIGRQNLIKIFKDRCDEIDSEIPEYNDELFNVIAEIIQKENEHQESATNIQVQINEICDRLGTFLVRSSD
tara:strand:+ start:186 stop:401 length:216 start_codon:yes stop_codon:yes gene_type:complete